MTTKSTQVQNVMDSLVYYITVSGLWFFGSPKDPTMFDGVIWVGWNVMSWIQILLVATFLPMLTALLHSPTAFGRMIMTILAYVVF